MTITARRKTSLFFLLLVLSALSARAAELRLKPEASCAGPLVRLGDLVEVDENRKDEAQRFLKFELFATPSSGQVRVVRAKEISELLMFHGIDRATLRITGADTVEIHDAKSKPLSATMQTAGVQNMVRNKFSVVVPLRTITKGETVRQGDVEVKSVTRVTKGLQFASRLEDVLGREASRQLEPSQPIDLHWLQQPLLVRRNETITIISRAAGVQVRTSGKAMEDGSKGDSIVVEELEGKKRQRYTARVSGFQEAEIFAGVTNIVSNAQHDTK